MSRNRNSRFSGSSGQSIRESIQNRQRAFSGGGRTIGNSGRVPARRGPNAVTRRGTQSVATNQRGLVPRTGQGGPSGPSFGTRAGNVVRGAARNAPAAAGAIEGTREYRSSRSQGRSEGEAIARGAARGGSTAAGTIAGAKGGAALGAKGGAVFGPAGSAVGALGGGLVGGAAGAYTGSRASRAAMDRVSPAPKQDSPSSTPRQQSSRPRTNAGERQASQRRTEINQAASQPSSFGQAFSQARAAGKSQFEWQGQQYHTRTREETQRMESRVNFGRGMTRASTPTDPTPEGRQAARRNAIMERRGTAAEPRRRRTTHPGSKPMNLNPNAR